MTEKLKDYQVLDVLCSGTFYKVRHKVTNDIFAWKAYNCSAYSDEQIQNFSNEVKSISEVVAENLLRYYDTILHAPSKTVYLVLEYNSWQSLASLISLCEETDCYIAESFLWYLLHELARLCKLLDRFNFIALRKCITTTSIFVKDSGKLLVNCFELSTMLPSQDDVMRQVGDVMQTLWYRPDTPTHKIKEFHYSDDLHDVVSFLTDDKRACLSPDVVLYHPTVLANLESLSGPKNLTEILLPLEHTETSDINKCDSAKAIELSKAVEPAPRTNINTFNSPVYTNISPRRVIRASYDETVSPQASLSPTIAALALELPGYVPRCRRPFTDALEIYKDPQRVSERTLSQQWMSRLIALRQRENSLNKRERNLLSKEICSSPATKVIPLHDPQDIDTRGDSNGITLPPIMNAQINKEQQRSSWVSRRHHRRSSSIRTRSRYRKTIGYEDLDSSLSADPGDGSIIVTATKFTKDNMPRRNIFPEVATKKVHFTAANPFVESDESVTLTFYELDNKDSDGYQIPNRDQKLSSDITNFKYLDLEKVTSEKRAAMQQWSHSSPSKQAKVTKKILSDITNKGCPAINRTPSKSSLMSKTSSTSEKTQYSSASSKSEWSMESAHSKVSHVSGSTRAHTRQSLAPCTPHAPPAQKKTKSRMSLLPFKTPFKFMSSK